MAMPTQFQVAHPPVQGTMGGAGGTHLHAPQSIFQHLMGQSNSQNQPGNWGQIPQIPQMYMPWSVPNLQQSQLVRFTGEKQQLSPVVTNVHQKRKLDYPEATEFQQSKQFISEEKMAAHFKNMHISSSFTSPQIATSEIIESQTDISSDIDLNIDNTSTTLDDGKSVHPRLVMSDELKRLQQEPLLPASLLSKLDRPSMALVLWEPPSRHLRMLSTRQTTTSPTVTTQTTEEENNNRNNNNNNNNNNTSIDNNNQQILNLKQLEFGSKNVELEPMDL